MYSEFGVFRWMQAFHGQTKGKIVFGTLELVTFNMCSFSNKGIQRKIPDSEWPPNQIDSESGVFVGTTNLMTKCVRHR